MARPGLIQDAPGQANPVPRQIEISHITRLLLRTINGGPVVRLQETLRVLYGPVEAERARYYAS